MSEENFWLHFNTSSILHQTHLSPPLTRRAAPLRRLSAAPECFKASQAELQASFRKAAFKHHPDRHPGKSAEEQAGANAKFRAMLSAYEASVSRTCCRCLRAKSRRRLSFHNVLRARSVLLAAVPTGIPGAAGSAEEGGLSQAVQLRGAGPALRAGGGHRGGRAGWWCCTYVQSPLQQQWCVQQWPSCPAGTRCGQASNEEDEHRRDKSSATSAANCGVQCAAPVYVIYCRWSARSVLFAAAGPRTHGCRPRTTRRR